MIQPTEEGEDRKERAELLQGEPDASETQRRRTQPQRYTEKRSALRKYAADEPDERSARNATKARKGMRC